MGGGGRWWGGVCFGGGGGGVDLIAMGCFLERELCKLLPLSIESIYICLFWGVLYAGGVVAFAAVESIYLYSTAMTVVIVEVSRRPLPFTDNI